MRPDIISGALFPDYELSDHHGMRRTISALQGGDPPWLCAITRCMAVGAIESASANLTLSACAAASLSAWELRPDQRK
jgi:hypothetical protein